MIAVFGLTFFFMHSYTNLPPHYKELRQRTLQSTTPGRANTHAESIFISISLYDKGGHLAGGLWGERLLELIDILGPSNTFLSVFENDSGPEAGEALRHFQKRLTCRNSIVVEEVDKSHLPTVTMPDSSQRIKRLMYLSEVRNRALRPLDREMNVTYDKLLFLNDVSFDPVDAAQLLFSTNQGKDGRAKYTAACAMDFMNPFQFYDVYATRDIEGYSMGTEIFPFFSAEGRGESRRDVLAQKDAVRVKSCWSGMAAFDAKYFQRPKHENFTVYDDKLAAHTIEPANAVLVTAPVRWRAEPEIFFDACECCLLMADTLALSQPARPEQDSGIYINPYVRVAYDFHTLEWLRYVRRVERLFGWAQSFGNWMRALPTWNPHRTTPEGEAFREEVWQNDPGKPEGGSWRIVDRRSRNGLYCGVREMQLLLQHERAEDKNWENAVIPPGRRLF